MAQRVHSVLAAKARLLVLGEHGLTEPSGNLQWAEAAVEQVRMVFGEAGTVGKHVVLYANLAAGRNSHPRLHLGAHLFPFEERVDHELGQGNGPVAGLALRWASMAPLVKPLAHMKLAYRQA